MLIQFRFQNFRSFRDDTILDLSATKITEHGDHVVTVGKERLLPAAAIYGANASGKSNVIEAFSFMATYVLFSFAYGGDGDKEKSTQPRLTPFLFDSASKEAESSFEVYFTRNGGQDCKVYNYGFTLKQDGVVEEWMTTRAKTARSARKIFSRKGMVCSFPGIPSKMEENITLSLEKEVLAVSLGAKLKIDILRIVRDWFGDLDFTDFGDPILNMFISRQIPPGFDDDKTVQANVVSYLSSFDPSILDFQVEKIKQDGESDQRNHYRINAVHRTTDGGIATIPFSQESAGTLKMFALYPALQNTLKHGSVMFVDELNSRLHPLLVRSFLLTFLNPEINVNHAQIIFTTHDAWQLSNNLLRRDEIWFTEKDEQGVSSLYSLADFMDEDGTSIRKDENYEKNYLIGKYGAVPLLKNIEMLKGE